MLTAVPDTTFDPVLCDCCGNRTCGISGWIQDKEKTLAAYLVHWTESPKDHVANFDLVFGGWGEEATSADRSVASFAYRAAENAFMVIDAHSRPAGRAEHLAAFPLTREQVVGTPLAPYLFGLLDVIWLQDERIASIRGEA